MAVTCNLLRIEVVGIGVSLMEDAEINSDFCIDLFCGVVLYCNSFLLLVVIVKHKL